MSMVERERERENAEYVKSVFGCFEARKKI